MNMDMKPANTGLVGLEVASTGSTLQTQEPETLGQHLVVTHSCVRHIKET